jgi:hypothetical protein
MTIVILKGLNKKMSISTNLLNNSLQVKYIYTMTISEGLNVLFDSTKNLLRPPNKRQFLNKNMDSLIPNKNRDKLQSI